MANPTWFDAKVYMANKLAQLKATEPTVDWTEEKLTKVMEENGFKGDEGAYAHFTQFGEAENVSPNELFDVKEYLAAKAKQLNSMNVDGKVWTEVSVMDAIKSAGMNSAWEHYVKFGSAEGINPSNDFNAEGYILAKTQLMNETSEGGRSNWTVAEVKAAFAENGLSALEHYNLFGQAEFKAENKETELAKAIEVTDKVGINDTFDPYTGAETYATLIDALAAQKEGSLAAKYTITAAADAGDVTVAQQAGLAALLAGATPAITTTPTYHLVDTVDALTAVSSTILMGSEGGYDISDTLANVAAGADGLVNHAEGATAKVAFGAEGADSTVKDSKADVVTTTVKYDDIDGKSGITLVKADEDAKGDAEIVIDASTTVTALGTAAEAFDVDEDALVAFDASAATIGADFSFVGTAKADFLTVGTKIVSINAGAGNDNVTATFGDTGIAKDGTLKIDLGSGNDTLTLTVAEDNFDLGTDGATATPNANIVLKGGEGTDTLKFANAVKASIDFLGDDQIQGFENIDLSGAGLGNNDANQFTLCLNHQTEKFTINAEAKSAQFVQIFSGQNADSITLGDNTTAKIVYGKDTIGAMDSITGFGEGDTIQVRSIDNMKLATGEGIDKNGVLTLTTTTLNAALDEANKAAETAGETVAFVLGNNSYIFVQNGDNDFVVELAGVDSLTNGISVTGSDKFDITLAAATA